MIDLALFRARVGCFNGCNAIKKCAGNGVQNEDCSITFPVLYNNDFLNYYLILYLIFIIYVLALGSAMTLHTCHTSHIIYIVLKSNLTHPQNMTT